MKFYSKIYCRNYEAGFVEFENNEYEEAKEDVVATANEWLSDGETAEIKGYIFTEDAERPGEPATHFDPVFCYTLNDRFC